MASPPNEVSKDVYDFLKIHNALELISDNRKVKCSLTGHEMPCKLDALQKHTQGKKYRKRREESDFDYEKYKPHIVPSIKKGHEHQLFCLLTLRHINRQPLHVEKHANGRRYKKALARYEECQRTGEIFRPTRYNKKNLTTANESGLNDGEQGKGKESWDGSNHDDSLSDSLSDLYPAADFEDVESEEQNGDHDSNSDFDPDDMEVSGTNQTTAAETGTQKKRKQKVQLGQGHSGLRSKKFKNDAHDTKQNGKGKKKKKTGKKV